MRATLLFHPDPEAASLVITTDASHRAVGAVLEQKVAGDWQPLALFSRMLSMTERRYSIFDRKLLAVYTSLKHFQYYREGRKLTIFMDHKPLVGVMTKKPHPFLWPINRGT